MKTKLTFLPVFFMVLAAAVAGAVVFRVRAYMTGTATSTISAEETPRAASRRAAASDTGGETATGTIAAAVPSAAAVDGPGSGPAPSAYERSAARRIAAQERQKLLLGRSIPTAGATTTAPAAVIAPPPPRVVPVKAPSAPTKSLVSKIVDPIRNFFSNPSEQPRNNETKVDPPKVKDPKDPTSDTTAPSLVNITFNPPTVHDGEESVVQIVATDDISGVRSVSASVASPAGKALRAFPFQKDAETDIWTGRVQIPKDAEEGVWHINFLSMTDNANNTANLTFSNGTIPATAVLRVISSGSDSQAPTLRNVWMDKRAITEGEHNTVFVQADDDKSGVALISGVFQSPKKNARIGFGCRAGDDAGGTWSCDVSLPKCIDCGDWTLEQVQLQDKANNQGTIRNNNPLVAAVSFSISGQSCDSQPPTLVSLVLDPVQVVNTQESMIHVTAVITDDNCGVASASGQAAGPTPPGGGQPPTVYFPLTPVGENSNTYTGNLVIPKFAAKGTWHVVWVQVVDKANNIRPYGKSEGPLPGATFRVN